MAEEGASLEELYDHIDTYDATGTIGALDWAALREYCEEIVEEPSATVSKEKKKQFTENLMNQTFYSPHSGLK